MSSERNTIRTRDVMTDEFEMIDGLMTVSDAVKIFREKDARILIINKRHEDDEFGLVLLSDIAKKVIGQDRSPDRVNVYEVMAKPVIAVDPHMDIKYCARLFENFGLAHAPVIENKQVIGIVSYRSIVLKGLMD